uniref:Putative secreted peptide n=1 Tax=Anopheles braziliensis TaxID=58242 RepID=A0A2M3ZPC4_9DIPT
MLGLLLLLFLQFLLPPFPKLVQLAALRGGLRHRRGGGTLVIVLLSGIGRRIHAARIYYCPLREISRPGRVLVHDQKSELPSRAAEGRRRRNCNFGNVKELLLARTATARP